MHPTSHELSLKLRLAQCNRGVTNIRNMQQVYWIQYNSSLNKLCCTCFIIGIRRSNIGQCIVDSDHNDFSMYVNPKWVVFHQFTIFLFILFTFATTLCVKRIQPNNLWRSHWLIYTVVLIKSTILISSRFFYCKWFAVNPKKRCNYTRIQTTFIKWIKTIAYLIICGLFKTLNFNSVADCDILIKKL